MRELATRYYGTQMPQVTVIGDFVLDRYWHGSVTRTNPEAPGVVVNIQTQTEQLGGAGGVAVVADSLGLAVSCFGAVGNDKDGYELAQLINEKSSGGSVICWTQPQTTIKHRIVAGQQLLHNRFDFEEVSELTATEANLLDTQHIGKVIVFADYAKGVCSQAVIEKALELADARECFVIVDPARGRPLEEYGQVDLIKLNAAEAKAITGRGPADAAKQLSHEHTTTVVVTDGSDGMFVCDCESFAHIPAKPSVVRDVTGAGDTVIAAIALGLVKEYSIQNTLELAAELAAQQVSQLGVAAIGGLRNADRL